MKRYIKKTQIIVEDNQGFVKILNEKKAKRNEGEPDHPYQMESETFNETVRPCIRKICLSGFVDDCQVFVFEQKKNYNLVFIKKVLFKNGFGFISGCSCNPNSDFLVLNQSSNMYDRTKTKVIKCMHTRESVESLLERFALSMTSEHELQNLLNEHCTWNIARSTYFNEDCTICGTLSNTEGLMLFVQKNNKWRCVMCNMNDAMKCRHGSYLDVDNDDQFSYDNSCSNTERIQSLEPFPLMSKEKFSVIAVTNEIVARSVDLKGYLETVFDMGNSSDGSIKIVPERDQCIDCLSALTSIKLKKDGILLTTMAFNVSVYVKKCKSKECASYETNISFQGTALGIVNYNNKFFITVELIKEYFNLFSKNGTPFTSWLLIKLDLTMQAKLNTTTNLPLADIDKIKSYAGILHEVFCEAIQLFLYDKEKFSCCQSPKVLQMDGVVISIRTSRMPKFHAPWIANTLVNRASNRVERQLHPLNKREEEIIGRILETKKCSPKEKEHLKKSSNLGACVVSFCLKTDDQHYTLYEGTELFARALTKKVASAASILPKSCIGILEKINLEWDISLEEINFFKTESPTLHGVYACINSLHPDKENVKLMVVDLFKLIIQKRNKCFYGAGQSNMADVNYEQYRQMIKQIGNEDLHGNIEITELMRTGVFFPNHPVVRKIDDVRINENTKNDCTKIYKKPKNLGAGVLLFICIEHVKCIGFVILGQAESPKVINEILLTRFKAMPKIVLYDNSCNLSEFIINRNPYLFDDTRFLVDGFHFAAHSNCANSYNASDYPRLTKTFNTSLVEQMNSQLRFIKHTAPFLKYNTFVLKLLYATMNINK